MNCSFCRHTRVFAVLLFLLAASTLCAQKSAADTIRREIAALSPEDPHYLERKIGGSVNGSMSHDDVRKLQRIVGTKVDGLWGPMTNRALQRYLNRVL